MTDLALIPCQVEEAALVMGHRMSQLECVLDEVPAHQIPDALAWVCDIRALLKIRKNVEHLKIQSKRIEDKLFLKIILCIGEEEAMTDQELNQEALNRAIKQDRLLAEGRPATVITVERIRAALHRARSARSAVDRRYVEDLFRHMEEFPPYAELAKRWGVGVSAAYSRIERALLWAEGKTRKQGRPKHV